MLMNDPSLPPLQGNLIKPLLPPPQHEVIQEWRIWSRLGLKVGHARKPSLAAPGIGDLLVLLPTQCATSYCLMERGVGDVFFWLLSTRQLPSTRP
ncbi:hypothetical protein CDAR_391611 [Caerostris darwini]|uniref:Uncharacterized protein n=1 Tax=Caerostris darwini TaxID=1538125 RepID=A0AAV4QK72_9ARAC|nr:hypothetical protein CDAR_391611 [Caerostris darwini]